MKLGSERVLERLVADESCHGAVFVSYSFDPAFFEEQVLHGLLRLSSDPVEAAPRFLDEARASLQKTPIVCIVDAGQRQPGRRLPYDLIEVDRAIFHPKLTLLLYATHARLLIGSGNLTRAGHGGQTELFFRRDLPYDVPEAVGLLRMVARFLDRAAASARCRGTQIDHVRDELARRTRKVDPVIPSDIAFLSSFESPILPSFLALVPDDWKIRRVSLLAPFHERDDAQSGERNQLTSVLVTLTERAVKQPEIELGVAWEDAPLSGAAAPPSSLEEHLGGLWARVLEEKTGDRAIDYFVLESLTEKQASVRDRRGMARRWSRADLVAELENGRLFPVGRPIVHGPVQATRWLHEQGADIALELHPAQRYENRRPSRRPLHAKLYLVEASQRQKTRTWVLMGSANASRAALLRSAGDEGDGGNVEAMVAFVLDGSHRLADFAPELVRVPIELVHLEGRDFPAAPPNLGAWIEEAVFRARERVLEVRWASQGPASLGAWALCYREQAVARGEGPPDDQTRITDFVLASDAGELVLEAGGSTYSIPILVDDLTALPVSPALADLSLRELLALLGRRVGVERLETLRRPGSKVQVEAVLESIFGEGFGTVDVFKAWWGLAAELARPEQSFSAFRLVIDGPMGARAVWDKLRHTADQGQLARDEAWFYGAELRRTLATAELPEIIDRLDRVALVHAFLADLARDLEALQPEASGRAWMEPILSFYGGKQ
jgi:hypothetical protein